MTDDVPRYPLAPLIAAMRLPFDQACMQLGLSGKTRKLYRDEGMTELVADRMAARAGLPAYDVWPDMLDRAIAEAAAADEERRAAQRAYQREWARRKRATPEGAEANRAARRAAYASNGEYERRREQRAYWADPEKQRERKRRYRLATNTTTKENTTMSHTPLTSAAVAALFESPDELGGIPGVTLLRCTAEHWPTMVDSPLERSIGYALVFGAPVSDDPDDGHEVTVAYCPDTIAATVAALPVSPEPEATMLYVDLDAPVPESDPNGLPNDLESICFADNYVRLVIQGLNGAIIGGPAGELKSTAEWVLDTHPSANALVMLVQFAALDGAASVG